MIQINDSEVFFQIQKKIGKIPFTQSEGWYKQQLQQKGNIVFFVDSKTDSNIAFWGKVQNIPFTQNKILFVNGETISQDINEKKIRSFYKKLLELNYTAIEFNSNSEYNIDYEIGLRRAGFVRPIGLFSCPLTINFQVSEEFRFDNNWKRNVKKAIAAELQFKEIKNTSTEIVLDVISMFKEMADLKNLGYQLEEDSLTSLLKSHDMRLFMVYDKLGTPIAARIVHDNKPFASDIYAANSIEARDTGATYFIMQSIFEVLKKENYKEFDFGRIPPSNHATDSVYVFKNASRGKKIQYNGEWSFYKNHLIEILMFFYKNFKLKKQRY
ncbi:hypothetical protein DFR65_1116 [Oceanihabitans sediminis]|uniref:GNAT family N-acetyltransferase n=1 Tax=Oceanihabitans sediminis TaxID=1812012 RepID=A0A368P828_9FLAO|nr:GNAT family N-acetyltransferase [Oceanihabitans sediminis]RBP27057.1 hypothetical protein DFR65_1116 [Oceanihabitans sediminis]RCU58626.1 GNAT family N-acetyltransferase [Oceanihabitans sediminis]